jgi:Mg2+/Co2+ transporter CorC
MLCVACERHRFPECFASTNNKASASALKLSVETRKTNPKQASCGTPDRLSSDGRSKRASESSATSSSQGIAVNQVQIVSSPARLNNIIKVVLNERLAYVNVYGNCSNEEALMEVVLNYFSHDNITEAKRLLVQEFQSMAEVTQYLTKRRNSSRPAHEAKLDDVIGILDAADTVYVFLLQMRQMN